MEIRTVSIKDAARLLEIYAPYVEKTAVSFEYDVPTEAEFESRISKTLAEYPYLAAEENGVILGYAYASAFHGRQAYKHCVETSIYVAQEARCRGIGRALYTALEEILFRQNVYTLYACVTKTDQADDAHLTDGSLRFHDKLGYKPVGEHRQCGYKFEKWYSVAWLEKQLGQKPEHPEPFVPFPQL